MNIAANKRLEKNKKGVCNQFGERLGSECLEAVRHETALNISLNFELFETLGYFCKSSPHEAPQARASYNMDGTMKRSRGRGRRQQNPVNRSYDSNGPDVRVRGTASQVYEKYQALSRDAMSSGDRVMAENYGQHAEHYYRIMLSLQPAPSEADKENTANGETANGEASNGEAITEETGAEPLVLVREGDDGEDKPAKPSPNASRRRGPLRKKKADASDGAEANEAKADEPVQGEAQVEIVADASEADDASEAEIASAE